MMAENRRMPTTIRIAAMTIFAEGSFSGDE
jgi:hypothetical protein